VNRSVALGCSATFVGAFDFGFLTLAAPALDRDLDLGAAYAWIFGAGSLAYGASVMPAGSLARRISPHRVLAAGLLLAATGATVVACAGGQVAALAGRALFGVGGGIAAAPAIALLAAIEPAPLRRAAFARLGGAVAVGFTLGVLLAATVPSWRAVLLAFATLLAALATLARNPRPTSERGQAPFRGAHNPRPASERGQAPFRGAHNPRPASERGQAPLGGAAAAGGAWWFGAATAAATAALALAGAAPLLGVAALGVAGVLARAAWRRAADWLPPARGATLAICAAGAATTASGVGATVLLGREMGDGHGLLLAAFGAAVPPAMTLARRLARRHGPRRSAAIGLSLQAVGIAGLGVALDRPLALAVPLLVFGAGHVIANAGTADAVTALAGAHAAPAGGLLVTAQFAGGGAGSLLILAVADAATPATAFALAAFIAAVGALAADRHRLSRRARSPYARTRAAGHARTRR
jgi:MFS family permease